MHEEFKIWMETLRTLTNRRKARVCSLIKPKKVFSVQDWKIEMAKVKVSESSKTGSRESHFIVPLSVVEELPLVKELTQF